MIALGLDLGANCGTALWDGKTLRAWSTYLTRRHESSGMRFIRFRTHLNEIAKAQVPEYIFYELVARHAGTHAAHAYGGYLAILLEWCETMKVNQTGIAVARIKKFATGKGNANKTMMVAAAERRFGPELVNDDDDRADALWVLACGMTEELGAPLVKLVLERNGATEGK